jgi:hypothetical protein
VKNVGSRSQWEGNTVTVSNKTGPDNGAVSASQNAIASEAQAAADKVTSTQDLRQIPNAGISAAVAMWKVGASAVTLLAALFYGIGRLLADGFYTNLGTSATAAGVNTISIIEPAAVLGGLVALLATAILLLLDILQHGFNWIRERSRTVWIVAVALLVAGAIAAIIYLAISGKLTLIAILIGATASVLLRGTQEYFDRIISYFLTSRKKETSELPDEVRIAILAALVGAEAGAKAGAEVGAEASAKTSGEAATGPVAGAEAGARAGAEAGARAGAEATIHPPEPVSNPWPRVAAVGTVSMIIIGLCIGAHYLGVYEADQVKKGIPVHISAVGLDISSISATRVTLEPIDSSAATKSLSARSCLLQIGPGASNLLLYDAQKHQMLSAPASNVIVITVNAPKQCPQS